MLRDALLCLFPDDFFTAYIGCAPPLDVAARLYLSGSTEPLEGRDASKVHNWFHAEPATRFELFDLSSLFQDGDRACFVRGVATAGRFAQTLFWVAQHMRAEALAEARSAGVSGAVLAADAEHSVRPHATVPAWGYRGRSACVTAHGDKDADPEEIRAAKRFVERWMDLTTCVIQRSRRHPLTCCLMPVRNAGADRFHFEGITAADRAARGAVDIRYLLRCLEAGRIEPACIGALQAARHLEALSLAVLDAVAALPDSLRAPPLPLISHDEMETPRKRPRPPLFH